MEIYEEFIPYPDNSPSIEIKLRMLGIVLLAITHLQQSMWVTFNGKLVVCIMFDLNRTARVDDDFVDGEADVDKIAFVCLGSLAQLVA